MPLDSPELGLHAGITFEKCVSGRVSRLCGRESIFCKTHTNEFSGKSKVAHECRVAGPAQPDGRRTCRERTPGGDAG
jgi:hypothetical protein